MKYTIQIFTTILLLFSQTINSFSQEVSQKMKRDIEVAEDVLESLWKTEEDNVFNVAVFSGTYAKFEGTYMSDYGVIFSSNISNSGLMDISRQYTEQANHNHFNGNSWTDGNVRIYRFDDEDDALDEEELAQVEEAVDNTLYGDRNSRFEKLAFDFLGSYSSILGDLKNGEKVTVQVNIKSDHPIIVINGRSGREDSYQKFFSATAKKEDIDTYQAELLTEEQFMERIDFSSEEDVATKEPELELLASMIHRLYKKDLTNSFSLFRTPRYERLKGYGVIYYLDFSKTGNRVVWTNNGGNYALSNKEDNIDPYVVEQNYERLEKELPEQMIDYGRLLKKMQPGEKLVFKAIIPKCKKCDAPSSLEYSVSQETLEAYNKNKMSLDKAIDSMNKLLGGEE